MKAGPAKTFRNNRKSLFLRILGFDILPFSIYLPESNSHSKREFSTRIKVKIVSNFVNHIIVILVAIKKPINNQALSSISLFSALLEQLDLFIQSTLDEPFSIIAFQIRDKSEMRLIDFIGREVGVHSVELLAE